ncbi:MAG: ABC transporter ATP-binding protein [Terrimicrobiaceae bacterium]|nr:ABC transporter ATP-binding protein [Terrimicrobiaceae bacterium]
MSVYSRTLRYFRPFVWPTIFGLLAMLAAVGLNLLKPWPFKFLIGGILHAQHAEPPAASALGDWFASLPPPLMVLWICLGLVFISLAWGVVNLISNYLFIKTGLKALLKLRTDIYSCLQTLPLYFHDSRRSADSSFRVAYDSQSIQTIYNKGFATILSSILTLVGAMGFMLAINWKLTLASFAVLPAVYLALRYFAERIRRESTQIQERESDVLAVAQEGLSSIRLVHAFGRENFEVRQFFSRASRSLEANLKFNITSVTSALVIGTLMAAGTALMYYVGARQVLAGQLRLDDLVLFSGYLVMLYQPLEQLSYTAWALEGAAAGMTRCFEVLDREPETRDEPGAKDLGEVKGDIAYRGVAFSYSADRAILRGIDLRIEPGETVAFVGGTGAGKSTLLSLLLRFYEPNAGQVLVDGQDIKHVTKKSLRAQIGMVLQDTLLFSTTVRENIAYGRPGASDAEIIEAAKRGQAYDFIMDLPKGFDSLVGERGGHLSVGQRQRIGIARAFLKDAPILLLDEPTSALDPTTESAIMGTIEELMRGRTTLIVTHRIATVHQIGRIAVLKNGMIVEFGPGPELLRRGGVYAELYKAGQYDNA